MMTDFANVRNGLKADDQGTSPLRGNGEVLPPSTYRKAAVFAITAVSRPYTSSTKLSASPDGVAVR